MSFWGHDSPEHPAPRDLRAPQPQTVSARREGNPHGEVPGDRKTGAGPIWSGCRDHGPVLLGRLSGSGKAPGVTEFGLEGGLRPSRGWTDSFQPGSQRGVSPGDVGDEAGERAGAEDQAVPVDQATVRGLRGRSGVAAGDLLGVPASASESGSGWSNPGSCRESGGFRYIGRRVVWTCWWVRRGRRQGRDDSQVLSWALSLPQRGCHQPK